MSHFFTVLLAAMASHAASLAAIIALISFIYTSFRQRRIEKSSMYQQLELATIDLMRWETENITTLLRVRENREKGNRAIPAEDDEFMQARCFQTLNLFELCIDSARRRTLPDKVFGSWLPWIHEFANEPGFQELWSEIRTNYVPGCRELIDAALENPENRFIEKICKLRTHGILKKYHLRFDEWKKDDAEEAQQSGTPAAHEKNEIAIQKGSMDNIEQYLAIFDKAKHDGYISHGEVYCGRATHDLKWVDNIIEQMKEEFNEYLNDTDKFIVFEIRHTAELLGFAIIEVNRETKAAILQDIMITKNRQGGGIGTAALGKIEDYLQKENMGILLLESGIRNTTVHKFFEKNGYQKVSVEYAKVLD